MPPHKTRNRTVSVQITACIPPSCIEAGTGEKHQSQKGQLVTHSQCRGVNCEAHIKTHSIKECVEAR
jgi:hypothetical protein